MSGRPTLISGNVWDADLANAAGNPILDGADEYGHGAKVVDDWLADGADQIKARFYGWRDRLKVSVTSGLQVSYTGTVVLDTNGDLTTITAGTLTLPNNSTGYIFINNVAEVTVGSAYPEIGIMLAKYTTLSGAITDLTDLRYQALDIIQPLALPEASVFAIGDIKPSARLAPQPGWLVCDGSAYNNSLYPSLAATIGTTYSLPGDTAGTFRVPNLMGRVIVGNGPGAGLTPRTVGELFGEEGVSLTGAQLAFHSHNATQAAHSHSISVTPHTHGIADSGHTHGLSLNPHSHSLNDPGHPHTFVPTPHNHFIIDPGHAHNITVNRNDGTGPNVADSNGGSEFISAPSAVNLAASNVTLANASATGSILPQGTGITIQSTNLSGSIGASGTGITIQGANNVTASSDSQQPAISVAPTGSNLPHNNMQPSLVLNYFIRAF